ncbi:uncharacterized protein [Henckelia pumila]|uniref:uncharacterized protein n=1 Tax=Henckelia pumila TaxID=405737 RepID=UPI003C6E3978
MFRLISTNVSAKEAWEDLQEHCEGSESVKCSKMRLLTNNFESMRMEESGSISSYDQHICYLSNEAFCLGGPISTERLVSKVLRSVPERFNGKFCALEESRHTTKLGLVELISSLQVCEMNLESQKKVKWKIISFQLSNESYKDLLQITQEVNESDLCKESISLITKKFGNYLKNIRDTKEGAGSTSKDSVESVIRLRRGMSASLSDEEVDEDRESNDEENHTSLTVILKRKQSLQVNTHGASEHDDQNEEELTLENVQNMYEELYAHWLTRNKLNLALTKENTELKNSLAKLETIMTKKYIELCIMNDELARANQTLAKYNSSTRKLKVLLTVGKDDKTGPRYMNSAFEVGEYSSSAPKPTVFVKESGSHSSSKDVSTAKVPPKQVWYFDSCISCHMPGSKDFLTKYVDQNSVHVTYGGGAKGKIVGKGTLNDEDFESMACPKHVVDVASTSSAQEDSSKHDESSHSAPSTSLIDTPQTERLC